MSSKKDSKRYSSFQTSEHGRSVDPQSRGSFRREPPVVPERVAVLKANYRQAWLYFLLVLCLIIAWGIPIRYAIVRFVAFRPADVGPRTAMEFVSITYEGISDIPTEVQPDLFKKQMETLKDAGYNSITLEDVEAFYSEGAPLPEKAVLLTFDHSRKSSYFDARKVLQKLGWKAVMFVWTKPILDEDPSALRWPYIRAMIGSGAWEAGAQSNLGFERIVTDTEGTLKNYLTSPRWLADQGRYETPEEYQERLKKDHEYVVELITRETKKAPMAFAFPYGDFGQYDERATLTRRLNMDLVDQFYDLAFVHGNAALNTKNSDPLRLNRLLVNPEWSAEDLLNRLEAAWPREQGVSNEVAMKDPLLWQVDWGGFRMNGESNTLFALGDNTGSKVWLNGTDTYEDFQARIRLKITSGQVGFFLRASTDGESNLYLGLGDQGEVWLRQKQEGMEPVTLGTSRYLQEPDGSIFLEVFLRGNQFFASTAGQPVFDEIIMTRGKPEAGIMGVSVWDPEVAAAEFELLDLNVIPFYNRLITWKPTGSRQPAIAGWFSKNGYKFTHLSPPWLLLGDQGRAEQLGWDPSFFAELAKTYNMFFTPEIIVERIDSIEPQVATALANRAREAGLDGVYCNLSRIRGVSNLTRITAWIQNMSKALAEKDIQLIVSLPPALSKGSTVNSLLQGLSNLKVATTEEDIRELDEFKVPSQRLVSWSYTPLSQEAYPLYMQLTGGEASEEILTTEVRSRILWEEGFDAFSSGKFEDAISIWTRWSEVEPYNEKPLRLIGDVYQRNQDYKLAVEYYKQSLELNPGQVDLVVTTAGLLDRFLGNEKEAEELLSLYQRLFPNNTEISLAQAGMFMRKGNAKVAEERIENIVAKNPDDLTALALLHPLLQSSQERIDNIIQIEKVGRRLGMYEHFAKTLNTFNLLIWPESWRLMDMVSERAAEEPSGSGLYTRLLPRDTVVREKFNLGMASDNWEVPTGSLDDEEEGLFFLSATPASTEATLTLKRSETMMNGFVEAELEQARGFFWLYARRSEGNMIRFGFESVGRLYLQIWMDGEMVTNISRDWIRPNDGVTLRLEVRGDAVFGYLDGRPAFGAPIQIPSGMNLGWWGMAPWAAQFGVAQALIREVAGGPLPSNIGIYRGIIKPGVDEIMVEKIKANTTQLTVFSPPWFFQDVSGEIRSEINFDLPGVRLLTRYYKIRLYPLIRSASARNFDVSDVVELAKSTKVKGFLLDFTRMPDSEWFNRTEKELAGTGIGLLAVRFDVFGQMVEVREVGSAGALFAGNRGFKELPLVDFTRTESPVIPEMESLSLETNDTGIEEDTEVDIDTEVVEETVEIQTPAPEQEAPSVTRPMVPSKVYLF